MEEGYFIMEKRFKIDRYEITVTNFTECNSLLKMAYKKRNNYKDLLNYLSENSEEKELFTLKVKEIEETIKEIKKWINKFNQYSKIDIKINDNYDSRTTTIRFNNKWTNNRIIDWLYDNGYPITSQRIHINTEYDCSGQVFEVVFNLKNQVATITEYLDV